MADWQPIGSVEVCVGTNGVTGVYDGNSVCIYGVDGQIVGQFFDINHYSAKAKFEHEYCKPRHRLIESADGSVCVVSTEEVDGKPVRMAFVRKGISGSWVVAWDEEWEEKGSLQDAIDRAARYVETGE